MKKTLILAAIAIALIASSAFVITPAKAGIQDRAWLGSIFSWGVDDYYGGTTGVYGYEEGTNATLRIRVMNDYRDASRVQRRINVSEVIVGFDWNVNYTNVLSPRVTLEIDEQRYFVVTFTLPLTTVASNLYLHGYTIYVKHVNATGGLVDTMKSSFTANPDFAVYSHVQMAAREKARINSQLSEPSDGFNSSAANILWSKAANETNFAKNLYIQADFAGALTHYDAALSLKNQAYIVEQALTGGVEDAQLGLIEAQAESFRASANYLYGLSNMWIFIGVGVVLFGIGYIIRGLGGLRKPSAPP